MPGLNQSSEWLLLMPFLVRSALAKPITQGRLFYLYEGPLDLADPSDSQDCATATTVAKRSAHESANSC